MHPLSPLIRWGYESLDRARKRRGTAMDHMGLGPSESAYQTLLEQPGMRLRFYGGKAPAAVVLIVPAPIKRHYIWDLSPSRSVVRHALERGFRVYMVEWTDPSEATAEFGLEEYAHGLLGRCVDAVCEEARADKAFLFSHSLGGVFTTVYAALKPQRVAGLVSIEAPLHFAEASGSFLPLLLFGPRAQSVTQWFNTVPGSILNLASIAASPTTFNVERYADWVHSLDSRRHMEGHLLVQRWTLDEAPMSRRLFEEVVEQLYREDRFMQGRLEIAGLHIGPSDVRSPFLAVYDPRSLIVTPESIIAFYKASSSAVKRLQPYHGDIGIALAHVGALMGDNAHRILWPRIFGWMNSQRALRH